MIIQLIYFYFVKNKKIEVWNNFLQEKKSIFNIIIINISHGNAIYCQVIMIVFNKTIYNFLVVSIIMFMIQKTLTLYYKQKLLHQTIEDYKTEIADKDKKIKDYLMKNIR